jgi:hypothetical protein
VLSPEAIYLASAVLGFGAAAMNLLGKYLPLKKKT